MEKGKYYHIFNRGNNREKIFKEEENYSYFLEKYFFYLSAHLETLAYCLMPNHFRFLIRVKDFELTNVKDISGIRVLTPIEKAFKDFFISYAKSINKRYNRSGSLFQTKFKRKEIDSEDYFRTRIVYIHNNPVESGLCYLSENWRYSSFNEFKDGADSKLHDMHYMKNNTPFPSDFRSLGDF